jgi:hypothetical protein
MIRVTLEIDNNTAHSCSPAEYLREFILQDARLIVFNKEKHILLTPTAVITVTELEQI